MNKIKLSEANITPFGGLNTIYQAMCAKGLDKFFDKQLGYRSPFATYTHSDVIFSLFGNVLVQGSVISDLQILKEKYAGQFFNKIPSPDTVEYVCQGLKTVTVKKKSESGVVHQFNYSNPMNETLIALALKTGQLKTGSNGYTLDFDNVVMENDKQDACYTYKKA